jgi:hypothetical protein
MDLIGNAHAAQMGMSRLFNRAGFMLVDGDYTLRPYEEWSP